jgi:tRNA(Arg) A34 adenosine deaminase TadA
MSTMIPLIVAGVAISISAITLITSRKQKEKVNDEESTHSVTVSLPQWAQDSFSEYASKTYDTDEEKMALAIDLSAKNVEADTGGPFGSAIYEGNKLVAIGMNRVVPLSNSTLHGETVAIQMAQSKLKTFSLKIPKECKTVSDDDGGGGNETKFRDFELFTSCEPCAMCLGATLWSGVSKLVCGAAKCDASAIGFDEGPVFEESYRHLEQAGIEVKRQVLKEEAATVLSDYGKTGVIYNR